MIVIGGLLVIARLVNRVCRWQSKIEPFFNIHFREPGGFSARVVNSEESSDVV